MSPDVLILGSFGLGVGVKMVLDWRRISREAKAEKSRALIAAHREELKGLDKEFPAAKVLPPEEPLFSRYLRD